MLTARQKNSKAVLARVNCIKASELKIPYVKQMCIMGAYPFYLRQQNETQLHLIRNQQYFQEAQSASGKACMENRKIFSNSSQNDFLSIQYCIPFLGRRHNSDVLQDPKKAREAQAQKWSTEAGGQVPSCASSRMAHADN
jgi:hypothetical protein